jgi:RNA polymerase sigma factor (sigma-70 family)
MDFPSTMWTSIRKIRQEPARIKDLVVRKYREPIFRFALQQGLPEPDAEDVAQEVFLRICEEKFLEKADRSKGKFRTLLLAVTKHVIASHRRHERAGRRDRRREIPIDDFDVPDDPPSDAEFDRLWVKNLMDQAFESLAGEPTIRALRLQLDGKSYREIAADLGKRESDVVNYIHRAKPRLKREIERLIAEYSAAGEVEQETRTLARYL